MKVPKQCEKCVYVGFCMDNNCTKDKPCRSRTEPVKTDIDLKQEIRERTEL